MLILQLFLSGMIIVCICVCTFICTFLSPGYSLLHSLVFTRLFPTLITLYVLHHEENDTGYQRGLDFLRDMDDERVATYIKFPESVKSNTYYMYTCMYAAFILLKLLAYYVCRHLCKKVAGEDADVEILKVRGLLFMSTSFPCQLCCYSSMCVL